MDEFRSEILCGNNNESESDSDKKRIKGRELDEWERVERRVKSGYYLVLTVDLKVPVYNSVGDIYKDQI